MLFLIEDFSFFLQDFSLDELEKKPIDPKVNQNVPIVSKYSQVISFLLLLFLLILKREGNHNLQLKNWIQNTSKGQTNLKLLHASNIIRPQLKFEDKIDNSNRSFVPKIKEKPNALQPLDLGEFI